jgi:hypothetical protein
MHSSKEELKKVLLNLLLEDVEFRHAVAGAIGYKEILDRIAKVDEDMNKRFLEMEEKMNKRFLEMEEKMNKRFLEMEEKMNKRFLEMEERVNARFLKVEEDIKELRKDLNDLRRDMQEGFKRHDEEFAKVWKSIEDLRRDMQEGFKRHDRLIQELSISIGSLGRRTGKDMERLILNIYRDQLMQLGIDKDKARRFEYIDKEGLYGLKGKRYEFDIIVSNSHADILEIKNRVAEDDVVTFYEKVNSIKPVIEREYGSIKRLVTVSIHIDREALTKAKELGIECIYGYMVRG